MTTYAPFLQALGLALMHAVWQITLLWLIHAVFVRVFRTRPQLAYVAGLATMASAALWFAFTFFDAFREFQLAMRPESLPETSGIARMAAAQTLQGAETHPVSALDASLGWLQMHARQFGQVWLVCMALLWTRLIGGWWLAQQLRHRSVTRPDPEFENQCKELARKLGISRTVRLLESQRVREPLTLGFWKPVILFPAGLMLQIAPAQLEGLLLHELAHIRRYDYLVNMLQLTLETCFFYHPLFWLISRDTRAYREFCCDDVVVKNTSNPILYARTLTDLQLSTLHISTQFIMNATGKSRFTERIWRIAGVSPRRESRPGLLLMLALPVMLALCSWWPTQAAPNLAVQEQTALNALPTAPSDSVSPGNKTPAAKANEWVEGAQGASSSEDSQAPAAVIEVSKMNVFYIGVDNPICVAAPNTPPSEMSVELDGSGTVEGGNGKYTIQVTTPGTVNLKVLKVHKGKKTLISQQQYRVKRIPDPDVYLNRSRGGQMPKEEFIKTKSLSVLLPNFDFDASCEIVQYEITLLPKDQDPITMIATGPEIPARAIQFVAQFPAAGGAVFFDDVKVKCPGDLNPRDIGGIAFKIVTE